MALIKTKRLVRICTRAHTLSGGLGRNLPFVGNAFRATWQLRHKSAAQRA